jgi:hypothetical protein
MAGTTAGQWVGAALGLAGGLAVFAGQKATAENQLVIAACLVICPVGGGAVGLTWPGY